MSPIVILFGLGLGIAAASSSASSKAATPGKLEGSGLIEWYDGRGAKLTGGEREANYAAVRKMGEALERAGIVGPGYGTWAAVVAYGESRGNPAAGSDRLSNAARGMFGLRPASAWNANYKTRTFASDGGLQYGDDVITQAEVDALKDLPWSVALLTDYVSRLRNYADGPITWRTARQGMSYPSHTSYTIEEFTESRPQARERWLAGLRHFGLPVSSERRVIDLAPLAEFPSVNEMHAIIMAEIYPSNGRSIVPSSREDGERSLEGAVYAWTLARTTGGPWVWRVQGWTAQTETPTYDASSDALSRAEALAAIDAQIEAWEQERTP